MSFVSLIVLAVQVTYKKKPRSITDFGPLHNQISVVAKTIEEVKLGKSYNFLSLRNNGVAFPLCVLNIYIHTQL